MTIHKADRLSSSLRPWMMLNDDLQREILSYFTVAERYGIPINSIVQFVRKHTTRVQRHQPVIPYYGIIRHSRKMSGLLRHTSSLYNHFFYRRAHNKFQLNTTIFRDYHSYHMDHIVCDWVIDVFPQWKQNPHIYIVDALYKACLIFQSKWRRRPDNSARVRLENITRMSNRVDMLLVFGSYQQNVPVGYFVPTEPKVATQQSRLEIAYHLLHELSVFLESTIPSLHS